MFCTFSRVVLAVTAIVLVGFGARATLAQTPIEQPAPKPAAQAAADLTEKTKKAKPVESDIFQTIWNLPESHVVVTTLDKKRKASGSQSQGSGQRTRQRWKLFERRQRAVAVALVRR